MFDFCSSGAHKCERCTTNLKSLLGLYIYIYIYIYEYFHPLTICLISVAVGPINVKDVQQI